MGLTASTCHRPQRAQHTRVETLFDFVGNPYGRLAEGHREKVVAAFKPRQGFQNCGNFVSSRHDMVGGAAVFPFILAAGTIQTPFRKSNSDHLASATSFSRKPVRIRSR